MHQDRVYVECLIVLPVDARYQNHQKLDATGTKRHFTGAAQYKYAQVDAFSASPSQARQLARCQTQDVRCRWKRDTGSHHFNLSIIKT